MPRAEVRIIAPFPLNNAPKVQTLAGLAPGGMLVSRAMPYCQIRKEWLMKCAWVISSVPLSLFCGLG